MNIEEIIRKSIRKANRNGYKRKVEDFLPEVISPNGDMMVEDMVRWMFVSSYAPMIIFSHEFAKAFWGDLFTEEEIEVYRTEDLRLFPSRDMTVRWQYHLQCMILEEEPIKYLEKFL